MAERNLFIAEKEWDGIDRLQIPTTEKDNPTATFYDTSDAATDETIKKYLANNADLKVYGQNGLINGGEMVQLEKDTANLHIANVGLQLVLDDKELVGKELTIIPSLAYKLVGTNGSLTINVDFQTALNSSGAISCSEIKLQGGAGEEFYIYFKRNGEDVMAYSYRSGWDNSEWNSSAVDKIKLTSEPTGVDKTNLLAIVQGLNPDAYYAYLKTGEPVYIDAPDGAQIFAFEGLEKLLPENVKLGTKIPGIKIDGTYDFVGTLQSAKISRTGSILIIE